MSVRVRKDRHNAAMVDIPWPDGTRSRVKVESEQKGQEIDLRAKLAKMDGTWAEYRDVVQGRRAEAEAMLAPRRFGDLVDAYLEQYVRVKNRSIAAKKSFLDRFKARWGKLPPECVRLPAVDLYVTARLKEGVKNATVNRELSCLRHMFTWAQRRGFVDRNPMLLMEKLEEPQWIGRQPTDDVVRAVFEKLDERFLPIFVLIRETGARRGEVLGLTRDRVDVARRMVTFVRTKTGKLRHVFLTDQALEAIAAVPELPGCPYVFYNPETRNRWSDVREPWLKARTAAGHPWLRVKDLRIAMGIELAEAGLELDWIGKLLGNTRAVAEKYYVKVAPESAPQRGLRAIEGGRKSS